MYFGPLTKKFITAYVRTLLDDVVEGIHELVRFRRSKVQDQGHSEVRYLSEFLLRVEAYTYRRLCAEVSSSCVFVFFCLFLLLYGK